MKAKKSGVKTDKKKGVKPSDSPVQESPPVEAPESTPLVQGMPVGDNHVPVGKAWAYGGPTKLRIEMVFAMDFLRAQIDRIPHEQRPQAIGQMVLAVLTNGYNNVMGSESLIKAIYAPEKIDPQYPTLMEMDMANSVISRMGSAFAEYIDDAIMAELSMEMQKEGEDTPITEAGMQFGLTREWATAASSILMMFTYCHRKGVDPLTITAALLSATSKLFEAMQEAPDKGSMN